MWENEEALDVLMHVVSDSYSVNFSDDPIYSDAVIMNACLLDQHFGFRFLFLEVLIRFMSRMVNIGFEQCQPRENFIWPS